MLNKKMRSKKLKVVGILCFCIYGLILVNIFNDRNFQFTEQRYEKDFKSYAFKRQNDFSFSEELLTNESDQHKPGAMRVPDVILQYGIARTATTLQFQIICLMMAFLHEDEKQYVGCTHYKQEQKKYFVIKTHVIEEQLETSLPSNTWVFMTSNSTFPKVKRAMIDRSRQKVKDKNLHIPLIADINLVSEKGYLIVYDYQSIFGIPDDKMKHIVEYLQYWDILRVCCGLQMSANWRKHLVSISQYSEKSRTSKSKCHLYNIGQVEQHLIETYAYRIFSPAVDAIGKLSVVDGKLDGNYCERCNKNITKHHLNFNEKCL